MRSDSVRLASAPFSSVTEVHRNIQEAVTVQAELLRSVSPRSSPQVLEVLASAPQETAAPRTLVYLGTYTRVLHHSRGTGKGVYGFQLDRVTGLLKPLRAEPAMDVEEGLVVRARGLLCPAYFCSDLGPSRQYIWAVNETSKFDYARPDVFGSVTLFRWHGRDGGWLEWLGECATAGHGACYPWTDRRGRFLFVANYWSGSVVAFYIEREEADGAPARAPRLRLVQHVQFVAPVDADDKSSEPCAPASLGLPEAMMMAQKAKTRALGFRRDRQDGPHSHQIVVDPEERFLYVPDLGSDRVYLFCLRLDEAEAELRASRASDSSSDACRLEQGFSTNHGSERPTSVAAPITQPIDDVAQGHQQRFVTPAGVVSDYPFCAPDGRILYETADSRATGVACCFVPHPGTAFVPVPPSGAGPRHMLLHPSGRWALVLCELNATLLCYPWDGVIASASHEERRQASGVLASTPTTVLDLLPVSYRQRYSPGTLHQHNISSALRLHPLRADRLYASNRGHDSVAVIEFSDLDGSMRVLQWVASGGRTPRDIALDPRGEWLFVANQDSDQVAVFAMDPDSGLIRDSSTNPAATEKISCTDRPTSLTTLENAAPDSTSDASGREPPDTATTLQLRPRQVLSICEPCTVFVEEIPPPPPTRRPNEC